MQIDIKDTWMYYTNVYVCLLSVTKLMFITCIKHNGYSCKFDGKGYPQKPQKLVLHKQ